MKLHWYRIYRLQVNGRWYARRDDDDNRSLSFRVDRLPPRSIGNYRVRATNATSACEVGTTIK